MNSVLRTTLVFFLKTRRFVSYTPILLAPAEGWGPFGPLGALQALLGPSAPSRIGISKLWKFGNSRDFDCNFELYRGKIWLWLFYNFVCVVVLRFYTKNFKSFWAKMKAWRWFSWLKMKSKFGKIAVTPSFLVEMTWDLCRILEP